MSIVEPIVKIRQARLKSTGEEVAIKVQVPKAERMFRAGPHLSHGTKLTPSLNPRLLKVQIFRV